MKSFGHILRRIHLYVSLFCLPWFVMYGVTSWAFAHPDWFDDGGDFYSTAGPNWTEEGVWNCTVEIPDKGPISNEIAKELLDIAGVDVDAYGAYRSGPNQVSVYIVDFWDTQRLTFDIDQQKLGLYSRKTPGQHVLTGMHARAGYRHQSFLNDLWAVMVDVVMVSFLIWVITGLYMWWQLPGMRRWGVIGLLVGIASFVAFILLL